MDIFGDFGGLNHFDDFGNVYGFGGFCLAVFSSCDLFIQSPFCLFIFLSFLPFGCLSPAGVYDPFFWFYAGF